MRLKENSKIVYNYVKDHEGENVTAKDIADATGLTPRQVNGIITMAFQRHRDADKNEIPLMERVPGEPTSDERGKAVIPKYIHLTDAGRNIVVEDAE